VNWSSRIPPRPLRRSTSPYPIRFRAVCSCGWSMGAHEVDRAGGAAYAHGVLTGHVDTVEVVRADDIS
jgi:hypothetical protein